MDIQAILRETVSEFVQIAPDQLTGDLEFRGRMSGSIARARLDSAIQKQLKIVCPQVYTARTYGELEAAVLGKPLAAKPLVAPAVSHGGSQAGAATMATGGAGAAVENVACGIDLESLDQFPIEADYWESAFYRANFSRAEIAYCTAQADPRQHFAARWCAKESLKKCDGQYLSLEMNRIEVVLDESCRPALYLRSATGGESSRLPVAVSLTHSGTMAAAVVVKANAAQLPAAAPPTVSKARATQGTSLSGIPGTSSPQSWWKRLFG